MNEESSAIQTASVDEDQINARLARIESMLGELLDRQPSSPYKDVMDTAEIAAYLKVSVSHIRKLVCAGTIPCYKSGDGGGRKNYFKRGEIDAWMASNRRKSKEELEIEAATRSAVERIKTPKKRKRG